jgi:hypothetical protein
MVNITKKHGAFAPKLKERTMKERMTVINASILPKITGAVFGFSIFTNPAKDLLCKFVASILLPLKVQNYERCFLSSQRRR